MIFVIQKNEPSNCLLVECQMIKDLISSARPALHRYNDTIGLADLSGKNAGNFPETYKQAIPIGTIEFTAKFLSIFHGINSLNPIEIPPILRQYEFLKRDYQLLKKADIPKTGYYFVKNASRLKQGSEITDIEYLHKDDYFNEDDVYQISEVLTPLSEYRVYVVGDKIYTMACYDGDVTIFPDVQMLNKAVAMYSMQPDCPHSYTMDVMVTEKGTAIIEIHVMFACGIYNTVIRPDFLYAYRDALKYTTDFNTPIKA